MMKDSEKIMKRIAEIAHEGGLIGFSSESSAMDEIRRLSLEWWDKDRVRALAPGGQKYLVGSPKPPENPINRDNPNN